MNPDTLIKKQHHKGAQKVWLLFWFWIGLRFGLPILFQASLYLLSALNVIIGLFFGSIFLFFFLSKQTFPRPQMPTLLFMVFFMLNLIASTFSPYLTSTNFLRIFGLLFMNLGIVLSLWLASRLLSVEEYLTLAGKAFATGFIIALILLVAFNATGFLASGSDQRFGDENLLHPNTIGVASGIALLFSLLLPIYRKQLYKIAVPLILAITLLSTVSKTSIGGFLLAISFALLFFRGKDKLRTWVLAIGAIGVGIIIFGDFLFEQINNYLKNERILSTISGRAQMWDFVLLSMPKRSWIGFGYSVFKDAFEPTRLLLFYRVPIVHAHNAFMDVLFSTGYLGLIIFIFFLTTIYLTIVKETLLSSKRKGIAMLALSASIFIATRTFTESALNLGFDTWILLTVYYSLEKTRLERWQIKISTKRNSIQ